MKKIYFLVVFVLINFMQSSCVKEDNTEVKPSVNIPEQIKEKKDENPDKNADWTPEQAARHQKILAKLSSVSKSFKKSETSTNSYADGALFGTWLNRGPKNMPGAFKFAEMLDGTDVIYGVTHNHYVGEFNSKSYIYKGTVYNPSKGTGGDDFVLLTANWPNRYKNLFAFDVNGTTRLIAHIENGPLYYSDDDGNSWNLSLGLASVNTSAAINRQDDHTIYVTNDKYVYVSVDYGVSFTVLQDFSTTKSSFLYTPRYPNQPFSDAVYLVRSGSFYTLNNTKTEFDYNGSYISAHGSEGLSIGGDFRKLYVTEHKRYWVSTNQGISWVEKFPKGNYYGDKTGKMSAGKFLAVNPENEDILIAGYAIPILSLDGLDNTISDHAGWGQYQNGTYLSAASYYNRIRFNYHPDIQSSHFFYNSTGELFSTRCTDGGMYISYKEWTDIPAPGAGYNNSGYSAAHFININILNTICPLIYRKNVFTGAKDPNHIVYSTQDQGTGSIIPGTSGNVLDFYQSIGGDGPPLDSYDGLNVWKWDRRGEKVFAPVEMYDNGDGLRSAGQINGLFNSRPTVEFVKNTNMGWVQIVIDHDEPGKRIWLLSKNLDRATWNGSTITGHTIYKGTNQVAAIAQAWLNPDKIFMLQDGKVFKSINRGETFGTGINTPFSKNITNYNNNGDIGSGIVLPINDNWILFCGPSTNSVASILSKDGGNTWTNVTGDFPSGTDAQTGGMVATPDGKFVFAGTDIGPYVFDVTKEKWFSIAEGIGFFNAMDVDYVPSTNTIRFGSWGSGILDFTIEDDLGLGDNVLAKNISIYPNPINTIINIKSNLKISTNLNIKLYNLSGDLVYSNIDISDEYQYQIDASALSSGVYFIKITDANQKTFIKKLIKE